MLLILTIMLCLIFVLFWHTIYIVVSTHVLETSKTSNGLIGNLWFILLLIINLLIITFILVFYYYKSTEPGKLGLDGKKGYDGSPGEPCYIKKNCINEE
jgi:hypothetical protein